MSKTTKQPCQALTRNGTPCSNAAMASGFCFTHDPERAVERRAARSKGGKLRLMPRRSVTPDAVPSTVRDNGGRRFRVELKTG